MPKSGSTFPHGTFVLWSLLLVWAPLPLASNRPWSQALLIFLVALCAVCFSLYALWRRLPLGSLLAPYRWPLILLTLVALWASLQCLPLPLSTLEALSPHAADIYRSAGYTETGYITLDIGRSQMQAAWSWALLLFFGMTLLVIDTRERIRQAGMLVVYVGVFQALYGSFMTLSGIEYSFFMPKEAYRGVATGTFVNRNSFAAFLTMCLSVGVGLLVGSLNRNRSSNWREGARRLLDTLLGSKMRLRVFLAFMVIALVLTRSRMGNTAFFTSLFLSGALVMIAQRKLHKGAVILFMSLLLVDFIIVGQWFGFEELAQRLEGTSAERETRDEVVRDTLVMLRDYPLTGTGLGSFAVAYPQYQQPDVRGFYDQTHNDYLQFASELGMLGMIPLGCFVLLTLGRALVSMFRRRDQLARGVAFACTMGVTALLIHSFVDFNLQMPANALLFMLLLAFGWKAGTMPRAAGSGNQGD